MSLKRYRDLALAAVPGGTIVVAADSCASTGEKSGDALSCPPYHCGRVSARVVLFELLCIGARVLVIADGICSELDPTGLEIIRGFTDELARADLPADILTGSTEDNFPTVMTGVGTAGVGYFPGNFVPPVCHAGDVAACLGTPAVGAAFLSVRDGDIATYEHLRALGADGAVRELIPVGSKGIAYEAENAAALHRLTLKWDAGIPLDLAQSGGPASCVVVILTGDAFEVHRRALPLTRLGVLAQK
jgi:hypothetical protein